MFPCVSCRAQLFVAFGSRGRHGESCLEIVIAINEKRGIQPTRSSHPLGSRIAIDRGLAINGRSTQDMMSHDYTALWCAPLYYGTPRSISNANAYCPIAFLCLSICEIQRVEKSRIERFPNMSPAQPPSQNGMPGVAKVNNSTKNNKF